MHNFIETGRQCSTCKTSRYHLSSSNPEGCSACNCDPVGSKSTNCDPVSGQCDCTKFAAGLQCDRCAAGW